MNELELKRSIFYLYDDIRVLYNDYYNGFWGIHTHYQKEDIEEIKKKVSEIETKLKDIKELLNNVSYL